MALILLITVRLHDGRYHGIGDYPPAPARLFQALVAGAGLSGPDVVEEYSAALRWLEALDPPVIAAPRETVGQQFRNYVPQNDLDRYGGDPRRIGKTRGEPKTIRPHLLSGDLLYAWSFSDDTKGMRRANAVCALAERLYQFGRGEDMAWAWGEVVSEVELEDRLSRHPGVVYRPSGRGQGSTLACPAPGSLDSVKERYLATGRRFSNDGKGIRKVFSQPPKPRFVQTPYDSAPERLVYTLRDTADQESFRAWPLAGALTLAQAVRDGVANRLRQALPTRSAEIEQVFIGRKANGDDDGPISQRVRIIPLPSIGYEHADRGIRRVLVEVPAECPFRADDVHWALSGLTLANSETGEVLDAVFMPAPQDTMFTHYGVGTESRRWRTVTPAALPGWIWRGIDRMREAPDTKNASRVVKQERAAEAVGKTLRFSNVRARVESVRVQREPFEGRGEPATAFVVGTRFEKGRLWHVEITFESPVAGPLVIGDGRFLGLGVMAPVGNEASSRNGAAGGAFVTPHAVRQFQERIERLPYNQALAAILHSLDTAGAPHSTANGVALYIRTRRPYRFRAILRSPPPGRELPSVVSILKG